MLEYSHMSEMLNSLNEAQKKAVVHETGPLLIVAGAGTGKTTVITSKITWLVVERGVKPEEILALTFTEKAAAEMEERVDRLLPLGYADLWISTFHSFAERILKEHALEIGLPQDFKLLNTTSQWLLVRQNLDRFNLDYYRPLGNPTKFIHALLKLFSRAKDENVSASDYLAYAERLRLDAEEIRKQQEIADAYALLEEYAMNVRHAFSTTTAQVIVKIRSLEDLRVRARVDARRQPAPEHMPRSIEAA